MKVAITYIKSEFLIDLIATVPTIIFSQNYKVFALRIFHLPEISKTNYPLNVTLNLVFPNSRINRINMGSII